MPERYIYTYARGRFGFSILVARQSYDNDCHLVYATLGSNPDAMRKESELFLAHKFKELGAAFKIEEDIGDELVELKNNFELLLEGKPSKVIEFDFVYGTDFQKSVWKEINSVQWGNTTTYKRIATKVGRPRASRAVANACGTNPLPILIPCHRVLGSKGSLGGYKWGTQMKIKLLEIEGSAQFEKEATTTFQSLPK
ncbi:LADA_0E14928g1_1 [Lachancea dasiensis]|uniref:Methylated-DNA--protein-cysteine methyltransferase n=1 Tax=Lachancea dasiensis TaxID=1072105 RepID=A0A1G4JGF5_9SACH|nr:LADA_0E14928g1_1 [Lachancea dasiensis]